MEISRGARPITGNGLMSTIVTNRHFSFRDGRQGAVFCALAVREATH
jgi:hypothetical protein